jgi:PAS domain-containing protein
VDMERIHLNIGEWVEISGARISSKLFTALDQLTTHLHSVRATLIALGCRVKTGHLRLQEALCEKERHLTKLLAESAEPMVVTDDAHRIQAAPSAALALFGVSQSNIGKFTIDAFLPASQAHCFERTGPAFVKGTSRLGECEIRRLDGKLKVVGFSFQANSSPDAICLNFRSDPLRFTTS